jgi:hypothetical protein
MAIKIKDLDSTATEIANILENELHLDTPVYLLFFDPITHCFYYYGKNYYEKILHKTRVEDIENAVIRCLEKLKKNESVKGYYLSPYKRYSYKIEEKYFRYISNNISLHSEDIYYLFLFLLLNTPISRHYGILGMRYLTRIPAFIQSRRDMRIEGLQQLIEPDEILVNTYFNSFKKIIDTLEATLLGKLTKIYSAIMIPFFLYGQIVGMVFVCTKDRNRRFNSSDYLRLIELCNEVSITYVKDAISYEFLKEILSCLHQERLRLDKVIFKSLKGLFNIIGICDKTNIYRIKNQKEKLLDLWCEDRVTCTTCYNDNEILHKYGMPNCKDDFLIQPKTILKMPVPITTEGEERVFNLFFNIPLHVMKPHAEHFTKTLHDALEITQLTEIVSKLQESHAHDVPKTLKGLMTLIEKDGELIKNYIKWKEEYRNYRTNVKTKPDTEELTDRTLKAIIGSLWLSVCQQEDSEKIKIIIPNLKIKVPLFKMGALLTILENLISNTVDFTTNKSDILREVEISYINQNSKFVFIYEQKHNNSAMIRNVNKFKDFLTGKKFEGRHGIGLHNIQDASDTLEGNLQIIIITRDSTSIIITKEDSNQKPVQLSATGIKFIFESVNLGGGNG